MGSRSSSSLLAFYIILSLITNFPSGFTNSTVNTAVEEVHRFINSSYVSRDWHLSESGIALLQSATLNCWFVCQIIGAMFTPYITDTLGRKIGYIIAISMTITGAIIQYTSILVSFPEGLILGRSVTALSSPLADACLLLYVQETSPVHIRGAASFFCSIAYGAMTALGTFLGMRSVLGSSLDRLILFSMVPEILSLIFLFFIPDTPKFFMLMKNDEKKAAKALRFFQGSSVDEKAVLEEYGKEKESDQKEERSSLKEILTTPHLRKAIFLASTVMALTLALYPILQSSTYFLIHSGITGKVAQRSSTFLFVVYTVAAILGTAFIDRYPRRVLVIGSGIASTICLFLFAIFSFLSHLSPWLKYSCIVSLFAYIVCFALVLGPVSWFAAPELVPQRHKATAFSICFAITNILIALTNFSTVALFRIFGGLVFIPSFILPSIACLLVVYFYLPETLGRETHEIVEELQRKKRKNIVKDIDMN